MFTNQRALGLLLIVSVIGTIIYFAYTKFKNDIREATISSSPTPSPAALNFLFNKSTDQPQNLKMPTEQVQFPGVLEPEVLQNKKALITTTKGAIEVQIYPEVSMTASNFIILATNGFYDGLTFHRVEDWVVQGGDPTGTGSGGPGYQFSDEPVTKPYVKGVVAMANSGPDTNGSQFFILKKDYPLQPDYTIFGQVILGQDVVDKLSIGDVMQKVTIQDFKPVKSGP